MMQGMRDNMKVIIWATAIIFLVGFGVLQLGGVLNPTNASGPGGVIAKINGETIRYDQFMGMYQNVLNEVRQTREIKEGEDSYIREQAWQEMLQSKLMEQEVRRRGITVTPEEIKLAIRFSPPEFVMAAPGFQTNGQFDYQKYLAELDNPNSQVPWAQVEAYVAQTLPQQKLQQEVVSAVKVSEADVRDRFRLINEKLKIRYVHFAADRFVIDTTKVSGADIETYYRSHPEEFTGPPEVMVQASLIPRRPIEQDFVAARERMLGIREQLQAEPDSFAKYARTYSEAGSNERGGDTPDALYSQIRPAFQAALKVIEPGQITDVIKEDRSVHLLRLDKRWMDPKTSQMMVHYHEIGFRVEPGAEAVRKSREATKAVRKDALKGGLAKAATAHGFTSTQSRFYREGNSNNDVFRRFPEVEAWTFKAKVGSISNPVPMEQGWYLFEIIERQPTGLRPLTQARVFARNRLLHSLQVARAGEAAAQARAAIASGASDADAAKQFNGTPGIATAVTRNGYLGSIGREPSIVGGMFGTPPQTWSRPLTGDQGALVGYIFEVQKPAEDEFQKQAPEIRETLLRNARQERFTEWIQSVRKRAKIEDYRENFFDV